MTHSSDLMTQDQIDQLTAGLARAMIVHLPAILAELRVSQEYAKGIIDQLYAHPDAVVRQAMILTGMRTNDTLYIETNLLKPIGALLLDGWKRFLDVRQLLRTRTGLYVDPLLEEYLQTLPPMTAVRPENPMVIVCLKNDVSEWNLFRELPAAHYVTWEHIGLCLDTDLRGMCVGLFAPPGSWTHFYVQENHTRNSEDLIVSVSRQTRGRELQLTCRPRRDGGLRYKGDYIVCPGQALLSVFEGACSTL